MKTVLFSAFLSLAAAPAFAQMAPPPPPGGPMMGGPMMGGPMMGGPMMSGPMPEGRSCVSGGQFVPCPPVGMAAGMGPGPAMEQPMPRRRMTKREMRMQRKMMRDQQNM